jgi:hypothetical protein
MTEAFNKPEAEKPTNLPTGAIEALGKYITLDENKNVVEHWEVDDMPQSAELAIPHAEFTLKIKGVYPLDQLVRIAGNQQNPLNQYIPQPMQVPYQPMQNLQYEGYNNPIPPAPAPAEQEAKTQPIPVQSNANQSWNLQSDEPRVEVVPRWARRASKKALAISALAMTVLVSGPVTQLYYDGPKAAEICATKDGITGIFQAPGCFINRAGSVLGNPANFLNIIPPHQPEPKK